MPHHLPWSKYKHHKTIQKQKFESFHNSIPSNFAFIRQKYFYEVKVFLKVINTHLYISQKDIKQEIS